jgi:hypothetical protein
MTEVMKVCPILNAAAENALETRVSKSSLYTLLNPLQNTRQF